MQKSSNINNIFYAATLLIFFIAHKAVAVNEVLTFTGMIKQGSCIATAEEVYMGEIGRSEFTGIGVTKGEKEFSIELRNCAGVDIAVVTMRGNIDPDNNNLFAVTRTGNFATGLALRIRTKDGLVQRPSGTQSSWSLPSASTHSLKYKADYVQTLSSVTAGAANVVAQFDISYR